MTKDKLNSLHAKLAALSLLGLLGLILMIICPVPAYTQTQQSVDEITVKINKKDGGRAIVFNKPNIPPTDPVRLIVKGNLKVNVKDEKDAEVTGFTLASDQTNVIVNPDHTLFAKDTGQKATITIKVQGSQDNKFEVEVVGRDNIKLTFEPKDLPMLSPGRAVELIATVKDSNNVDVTDKGSSKYVYGIRIRWSTTDEANQFIKLLPDINNDKVLTVVQKELAPTSGNAQGTAAPAFENAFSPAISKLPASFTIIATELNSGATNAANLRTQEIGFQPLEVTITQADEQVVKDVFGDRVSKEFFVAEVFVNNNVRSPDGAGSSILLFSQNFRAAVSYEGKYDGPKDSDVKLINGDGDRNKWVTISPEGEHGMESSCKEHPFLRRAYPYDTMTAAVNSREDRDLRNRLLLYANLASTMTSFVTSIAVPGGSSDLPLGLDKFKNLLIPGYERLFSDKRETHRQQILEKLLQPIEEVAFGQQITKYILFPKKPFHGLKRGYKTRISEICPRSFQIEVAVLKNGTKSIIGPTAPSTSPLITISGDIKDKDVNIPLPGVTVNVTRDGVPVGSGVTDGNGHYAIGGLPAGGNYVVTPVLTNRTFTAQTFTGLSANQSAPFNGSLVRFNVGGVVKDNSGVNLSGVIINITRGDNSSAGTDTTGSDGSYTISNLAAGDSYTVTPSKAGFTFNPSSTPLNNLSENRTANFVGTQSSFKINGVVRDNSGAGLGGVTVAVTRGDGSVAGSVQTLADGSYSAPNLAGNGNYTLTPTKSGFIFPPQTFNKLNSDQTTNFVGTPSFNLTGVVKDNNNANLAGVTVTVKRGDGSIVGTTTTGNDGTYTITNLPAGVSYIVTPAKTGITFNPQNQSVTLSGNQTISFTGTLGP